MEAQFIGESDGLTFWLARQQDYDEVMAISQNIFDGNDYLPHRFHAWMTEPDRVVVIARRNGKLVALESGLVVNGGKTVILEGLRVCPSERGQGVAGVLQRVSDRYIKQIYPSVTTKWLTRGDKPGPEKLLKFTVLAEKAVLTLSGSPEGFREFILHLKTKLDNTEKSNGSTGNSHYLSVVTDSLQLRSLLLDPELPSRVQLPGGAIILDWQPLMPTQSNLEIFSRRKPTWLFDFSNDKPTFMSCMTFPYPIPLNGGSLRLNIDMFGIDLSIAKKAFVAHLEQVAGEIYTTVVCHVYISQTIWAGMREFCEDTNGMTRKDFWHQLFLEKRMQ